MSQQRMKWGFISVLVSCTFSILPPGCQGSNLQLNLENIQQKKKVKLLVLEFLVKHLQNSQVSYCRV